MILKLQPANLSDRKLIIFSRTNLEIEEIKEKCLHNISEKDLPRWAIGIFLHYRDVKVALEELTDAGFPLAWMTLIARDNKHFNSTSDLTVCNDFNDRLFNFSGECQQFYQQCFNRGKYILRVEATDASVDRAKAILGRRQHSQVWDLLPKKNAD